MGQIVCVTSQKGGTGKTTTAVNLAASLALLEKDTLLVDADPLGNATTGIGLDKQKLPWDLYDVLTERVTAREALCDTSLEYLQVLPARYGLHHAESILKRGPAAAVADRMVLHHALSGLSGEFEVVIIDSPPSLGFMTQCALAAADFLLLPIQQRLYAYEGLSQLLQLIRHIRKTCNPSLRIAGLFYTMQDNYRERDRLNDTAQPTRRFGGKLLQTTIPFDPKLAEAADMTAPLALLDMKAKGAVGYLSLARELLRILDAARSGSVSQPNHSNAADPAIAGGSPVHVA